MGIVEQLRQESFEQRHPRAIVERFLGIVQQTPQAAGEAGSIRASSHASAIAAAAGPPDPGREVHLGCAFLWAKRR